MRVTIHNPVTSVCVDVRRTDHVASLKARYLDAEGFVGDRSNIVLVHRGRVLEDLRQLRDYGIESGAVLAHVPPELGGGAGLPPGAAAAPRERVDYAQVARLLAAAREETLGGRAQDPADYVPGGAAGGNGGGGDWASGWTGGGEWRDYPLVMGGGGASGGGSHLPAREDVVLPPDEGEEGEDAGAAGVGGHGGVSSAFLASAGDDELAHAEARLLARSAALDSGSAGGGGGGGETDSNASVPRSPVSERKVVGVGGGGAAATTAGAGSVSANGVTGGTPTATDAAAARERAQVKAALRRVREARRARQAIVWRGPDDVVPFSESGGAKAGIAVAHPTRVFRSLYVAQVGRFAFRTLHRLEGRWVGDAEAHVAGRSAPLPDVRVVTTTLSFDDLAGVWHERQSLTSRDGLVTSQHMTLRPVADGTCSVELLHGDHGDPLTRGFATGGGGSGGGGANRGRTASEHHPHHHGTGGSPPHGAGGAPGGGGTYASSAPGGGEHHSHPHHHGGGGGGGRPHGSPSPLGHGELTLTELGDSVLVLTSLSRATGRPLMVETITLTSDMQRSRTVQRFDEGSGALSLMYVIRETRVIDAVTGAMVEPSRYRAPAPVPGGASTTATAGGRSSAGSTTTTTTTTPSSLMVSPPGGRRGSSSAAAAAADGVTPAKAANTEAAPAGGGVA